MKAILIVRTSTDAQDTAPQRNALVTKANELNFTELHIIETHESGKISMYEREGVLNLFTFIEANNEYKTVFCSEQSRIGRDVSDLINIKRFFLSHGVSLYDLSRNNFIINAKNNNPQDELLFNMVATLAEIENIEKGKRVSRALKDYWKLGESHIGKVLFGYEKELNFSGKRKKLIAHQINSKVVQDIFNVYEYGIPDSGKNNTSILDIVRYCLRKDYPRYTLSKSNIKKLLKESAYTGNKITRNRRYTSLNNEKKIIDTSNVFKFPIIISQEQFDRVQELLKTRTVSTHSYKHITLLSKKIKCPSCNLHFVANYRQNEGNDKSSYRCSGRHKEPPCMNKSSISLKMLNNVIWSLIKSDELSLLVAIRSLSPEQQIQAWKYEADSLLIEIKQSTIDFNLKSDLIEKFARTSLSLNEERIIRLELETNNISKNIEKLESRLMDVTNKINNYDFSYIKSFHDNITKIESSLDSIRSYIDFFIDKIYFIKHCKRYTHLKVNLKINFSRDIEAHFPGLQTIQFQNSNEFDQVDLIVDKLNTNRLKIYKSRELIELRDNEDDVFLDMINYSTTLNELRKKVNINSNSLSRVQYITLP